MQRALPLLERTNLQVDQADARATRTPTGANDLAMFEMRSLLMGLTTDQNKPAGMPVLTGRAS
jgi:hypothetical protein